VHRQLPGGAGQAVKSDAVAGGAYVALEAFLLGLSKAGVRGMAFLGDKLREPPAERGNGPGLADGPLAPAFSLRILCPAFAL